MVSHRQRDGGLQSGLPIPAGLLYYSQLDSVLRVEARPNEIRALIMARNDLAHHLAKQRSLDDEPLFAVSSQGSIGEGGVDSFLPPTIDSARECKNCYAVDTCMLYRKVSRPPLASRHKLIR